MRVHTVGRVKSEEEEHFQARINLHKKPGSSLAKSDRSEITYKGGLAQIVLRSISNYF